MTNYDGGELTIPVSNLEAATDFYLRALHPLNLDVKSEVQHRTKTRPPVRTRGIALGPKGTLTTLIFLSESELGVNRTAHVVLPVSYRINVREIYSHALDAGAQPIRSPDYTTPHGSLFNMIFRDPDGNSFEAAFNDAVVSPSEYADESNVSGYTGRRHSPHSVKSSRYSIQRSNSSNLHHRNSSPRPSSPSKDRSGTGIGGNAVVGTLIGVTAGAVLGYMALKSKGDSRHKENEYKGRMHAREMMEHEARNNTYDRMSTGVVEVPNPPTKSRRGSNGQERDSGYSSWSHDESPKRLAYRSGTWPKSRSSHRATSVDTYSSKHNSDRREYHSHAKDSPDRRDKESEASSQRTIRQGRSHISVSHPPSPPTVPQSRPRRASSVKNRRIVYDTGDYDAGDYDRRSVASNSRQGSVANALPPSSFPKKALGPPPAKSSSSKPSSRPSSRQSSGKPPPSRTDSTTSRSSTSKVTAVRIPGIPNEPVNTPAKRPEVDDSAIDDLGTVVPDDSISCVGSERDDERRSRAVKASKGSKSSKRGNKGMDIVRRAGIVL